MKKSTLFSAAAFVTYTMLSRSLRNKNSNLSKLLARYTEKMTHFLSKCSEPQPQDKEELKSKKS